MKQKLLLMTIFYNPAVMTPEAISESANPIAAEALFTGLEACVEKGAVVRVSHSEADLVRLARGQNGCSPAHEWVGLAFVPVQPAAEEAISLEEVVDAY